MAETIFPTYSLILSTAECHPNAEWFKAVATLTGDISPVIPYLNAALRQPTDFRKAAAVLFWKEGGKTYAFRAQEVTIAPVADSSEAQELVTRLAVTVDAIWQRRAELTPSYDERAPLPTVMEIFKKLPKSNCKICGLPTCMAYAVELRADFSKLALCPHLAASDFDSSKA